MRVFFYLLSVDERKFAFFIFHGKVHHYSLVPDKVKCGQNAAIAVCLSTMTMSLRKYDYENTTARTIHVIFHAQAPLLENLLNLLVLATIQ